MSFSNSGHASNRAAKVCHNWANQLKQSDGERGRETTWRIFFEGPTIYSYGRHFSIAEIHSKDKMQKGTDVVLFTNRRNSLTTNKHIACAWDACSQYRRIKCMNPSAAACNNHDSNMGDWESDARNKVNEIAKARDKESRFNSILHFYNEAKEYADYFEIPFDSDLYPHLFFRASPEALAQLEVAKKAREAKERAAKAQAIELYNEYLGYWRNRETVSINGTTIDFTGRFQGADPLGHSYFRYNPICERLQTTQAIDIPITVAKRFLTEICPAICNGEVLVGAKILGYTLLEANKDYIRVGCHKITVEEIKRQATAMGWEVC